MKYAIRVAETLAKTLVVEANDVDSAIDIVRDKYKKGNIIFTEDDCSDVDIEDCTDDFVEFVGKKIFDTFESEF